MLQLRVLSAEVNKRATKAMPYCAEQGSFIFQPCHKYFVNLADDESIGVWDILIEHLDSWIVSLNVRR